MVHNTSYKGIRIPETGKFLLKKSGIPSFGIQNTTHGIDNSTNDWNPESELHWQRLRNPVTEIRNLRRGIQNPSLGFPNKGRNEWVKVASTQTDQYLIRTSGLKAATLSVC